MTLCVAWLREINKEQELIFATDSCLSGGERWHSGVKLFELPRKDCLICFAGETNRTYPLILNLITSIKFDEHLSNSHTDITEVLDYLTRLFTSLCHSITDYGTQEFRNVLGDFQFLFGGWSWKTNQFKLWKLEYNHEAGAFVHDETNGDDMLYCFIGDELEKSQELLVDQISKSGKTLSRRFDMEPFKVLIEMIPDTSYSGIDGAVQLAKIHPPGATEFLGVYWPSVSGKKTFLGKDVSTENNPAVKFVDPDTGEILEDTLPEMLSPIDKDVYGDHTDFLLKCYPEGQLKTGLSKRDRSLLKAIIDQIAYSQFMERQQQNTEEEQAE
ncbi:MAG: hypothetical protein Q8L79_04845 [Methylobacter sp.]|uniref:hypothetical protein n=1 Tax=Methylobacter sp. TaxID=2051955 RepID=UPI0027300904|nr:hypothetical protein [Methylobacter sp.]MDP1664436.1 hypothetical protein [Methylobacter sp.]